MSNQLHIFQHIISLEPSKLKWCGFHYNVQKISMIRGNYTHSRICYIFVKYANNYYVISDIKCVNMHPLTTADRALILALWVENVDRMLLEFPNNGEYKHCITGCKKWSSWQWRWSLEWRVMRLLWHDQTGRDCQCHWPVVKTCYDGHTGTKQWYEA